MKRCMLLFFTVLIGISVYAQPLLEGNVEVWYPTAFQTAIIKESDTRRVLSDGKFGQVAKSRKYWIAYSDRTNNKLYSEPYTGSLVCGTLEFNEKVRIAKIEKNGFALVYTEPMENSKYPQISPKAVSRGYINIRNLLLWHTCPANEYNIYNKALLCVNLDKKQSSDLGRLYGNPSNKSNFVQLSTDMNFYFIMKKEGNMALLARQHSMEGSVDKVLVGWVAEGSYVPWNQRSCLEPTWDRADVEAFANARVQYKIYHEEDRRMQNTPVVAEDFTTRIKGKSSRYKYRMMPHILRFPILSTEVTERGDTVYKCSTFGTSGSGNKNVISRMENMPDQVAYTDELLQKMSNIDIAIVIDGTKSMGPYFQAVKQAIRDAEQYFESGKFKIRVGLVIYRDYSDGEGNDVEVFPFVDSKSRRLGEILDNGGGSGYGFKSSLRDNTMEEALYYGIDTALEKLNFNEEHSNLMFVIGDCGNHRDDNRFNRDALVRKITDKNVHFMGFQVNYGTAEAFASFNNQLQYLMSKSLLQKYKKLDDATVIQWKETGEGYELVNSHKSYIYVGAHYSPKQKGQVMEVSKLTSLMGEAIEYCKNAITTQKEAIYSVGFSGSSVVEGVKINEAFARQRMGEEAYEMAKNGHNLLAFQGYTAKKTSSREVYKPVLFISAQELEALLRQLEGVNAAAADNNDREPYITAMKALLLSLSPGMTQEQINATEIGEIMKMVMGLNEAPDALQRYTLEDIGSRKVSPEAYRSLVKKFSDRYDYLMRLSKSPYEYTYKANNIKYYWLPIEYLP